MKLELKRGDSRDITITTDASVAPVGSTVYFMAKPEPDDDLNDAAAVINKQADEITDIGGGKVRIRFSLNPSDTMNINTGGEEKVQFKGEVEIHTPSGRVVSIPIGIQYSKTHFYFRISRELYWFKGGKVQDYTPASGPVRYDELQGAPDLSVYAKKSQLPDLNALKAQTLSEVRIDSANKVSNGVITSGKLNKGTFNRGSYNETTGVINQQYGRLVTELIPVRSGNYLILASFDQNQWKNGASMDCTVVVKINEDTVQRATFNTTNWHFGMTQLMRSLKSTDRVIAEVEAGQAIEVQSTIRLSLIPLEAF